MSNMKNEYLIRMEEPEDCLFVSNSESVYYRLFLAPVTRFMKNEFDCMHFHSVDSTPIDYHEHNRGTETFFVSQGKFHCNCMGRDFIMQKGDIFHIQPWMGHGFAPLEANSRINILFMGLDQKTKAENGKRVRNAYPEAYEKLPLRAVFREYGDYIFADNRNHPLPNEVPADRIHQLRPAGIGLCEHEFDGIKMHLKVARHETEGVKEIWDLHMKAGFYCKWDEILPEHRLFYVRSGKLRCTVKTSVTENLEFDAVAENLIRIPPYTPFSFEVAEDAEVYDMDCAAHLQDLCEEVKVLLHNNPEKASKKEDLLAFFKEFDFNCTDFGAR